MRQLEAKRRDVVLDLLEFEPVLDFVQTAMVALIVEQKALHHAFDDDLVRQLLVGIVRSGTIEHLLVSRSIVVYAVRVRHMMMAGWLLPILHRRSRIFLRRDPFFDLANSTHHGLRRRENVQWDGQAVS